MTPQTRTPIDPNSPRGRAAAAAMTEVIGALQAAVYERRAARVRAAAPESAAPLGVAA